MRYLALATLLALMAFFAAAEFAVIRLRPSRVQQGAVLALLAVGWTGRGLAGQLATTLAKRLGQSWLDALVFLVLVLLATVFGGLLPKAWVLHRPESSALQLAPLLESLTRTLSPLLLLIERITAVVLGLVGLPRNWDELVPVLSAGELETLIESGGVTGLMPDERSILEGVFSLRDTSVREVMVPRSGMVTLDLDVRFAEMMEIVHASQHARFPVQESTSLADLLPLIRSGQPLLVVVDEHGGTEGLVTVADLTSEIVGDDEDPLEAAQDLMPLVDGGWSAAGDLEIFELNRQLALQLPEAEGHHTLAGFLLERFQHIPMPGETLGWKGNRFTVLTMDGPRIERVQILASNGEGA